MEGKAPLDLGSSELWSRLPTQSAAACGQHLVIFDPYHAHVYDLADFAKPRFLSRIKFGGVSGAPVGYGNRVYTRQGILDLSDPTAPTRSPMRGAVAFALDGDQLYLRMGRGFSVYSADGRPEFVIPIDRPPSVFTFHAGHLYQIARQGDLQSLRIEGEQFQPAGSLPIPERPHGIHAHGDFVYLSTNNAIYVVDIHDPGALRMRTRVAIRVAPELQARGRFVFANSRLKGIAAIDLQAGKVLATGPRTNSRYLQVHRDHLFVGRPVGGVGIYESSVLQRVAEESQALAAAPNTYARAKLAHELGSWTADREMRALAAQPQGDAAAALITGHNARRSEEEKLRQAAATFTAEHKKHKFAFFPRTEDGLIREARVRDAAKFREHLNHLKTQPIRKLQFTEGRVTEPDLTMVGEFTGLRHLELRDIHAPVEAFAVFAGLKDLRYLDFHDADLPAGALRHLAQLTQLTQLDLDSCAIRDPDIAAIAGLTNLTHLNLQDCPITDAALVHLRELRNLTDLNLAGTRVTGSGFANLATLESLERLELHASPIDQGFEHVAKLRSLRYIRLSGTDFGDEDLLKLQALPNLQTINAHNTQVTAAGVAQLPDNRVFWQPAEVPAPRPEAGSQAQEAIPPGPPAEYDFALVGNKLALQRSDAKDILVSPEALFNGPVELRMLQAWEDEVWVGSNRGLLRVEPHTQVWSRFAIDREHLEVPVHGLGQDNEQLIIKYGENAEARFHLRDHRWLVVADSAATNSVATGSQRWVVPVGVGLLLFCLWWIRRWATAELPDHRP